MNLAELLTIYLNHEITLLGNPFLNFPNFCGCNIEDKYLKRIFQCEERSIPVCGTLNIL